MPAEPRDAPSATQILRLYENTSRPSMAMNSTTARDTRGKSRITTAEARGQRMIRARKVMKVPTAREAEKLRKR